MSQDLENFFKKNIFFFYFSQNFVKLFENIFQAYLWFYISYYFLVYYVRYFIYLFKKETNLLKCLIFKSVFKLKAN